MTDTHGLCRGLYISHSEVLHQFNGKYDREEDLKRLKLIIPDSDLKDELVEKYADLNGFVPTNNFDKTFHSESQRYDHGGWNTTQTGERAVEKISRESDGDYYCCPYCNAKLWPAEVEGNQKGYNWSCCKKGTLR